MYRMESEPNPEPLDEYYPFFHSKITEAGLAIGAAVTAAEGVDSIVTNYSRGLGMAMVVEALVLVLASRAARFGREHSDYGQQG